MAKVKADHITSATEGLKASHFETAMAGTKLGSQVAYYESGDKAQAPMLAFVSGLTATGLNLHVFTARGMTVRDYTRHIDDPWFAELDQRQKTLREKGAWDTLKAAQQRIDSESEKRQEEVLRRQRAEEAGRQTIIDDEPLMEDVAMQAEELARQGFSLPDIVTQLRGQATIGQLKNHFENNTISA